MRDGDDTALVERTGVEEIERRGGGRTAGTAERGRRRAAGRRGAARRRTIVSRLRLRRPRGPDEAYAALLAEEATTRSVGARQGQARDSLRRRSLAASDVTALAIAYALTAVLVSGSGAWDPSRLVLLGLVPLWILLNKLLGLYDRDDNLVHSSTLDELPRIAHSVSYGTAAAFIVAAVLLPLELAREGAVVFWVLAMALTPTLRSATRAAVQARFPPERCLIVGSGPVTELIGRKIAAHPEYGAEVVGVVDVRPSEARETNGSVRYMPLPDAERFEEVCRSNRVERVVIAFSELPAEELTAIIRKGKLLDLKVTVVPRLFEAIGGSVEVDQVEGFTLLGLRGFSRTRSSLALKRAIDVSVAAGGLLLLSPLLLTIAAAVRLTSPGPVLYRQRRIGRHNEPFMLLKFRTMQEGADALKSSLAHLNEATGPMFKIGDDPRVTGLGRHLRRTSLDELPQLWNVLRGEMSLVGPRPLVPDEDDQVVGWHRERLQLTPGLTGPWQVMGRTTIPFDEMIQLDYFYVSEWSLWNDLKLLLRTAPVVLQGRGH